MNSRAVVVGGFTTGKRILEPVAQAVCERFGFEDADVFRFTDVIGNPARLQRALRGGSAFVHSAGLLAVAQCQGMEHVTALNSPEPVRLGRSLVNASIKSGNLYRAAIAGPDWRGPLRVAASNGAQLSRHPLAHFRNIPTVGRFSAAEQLGHMEAGGVGIARIDTDRDEFFGPNDLREWDGRSAVLPGCHDQVLIDPVEFVGQLPEDLLTR